MTITKMILDDIVERIAGGEPANQLARLYGIDAAIISKYKNAVPMMISFPETETHKQKVLRLAMRSIRYLGTRRLQRAKRK